MKAEYDTTDFFKFPKSSIVRDPLRGQVGEWLPSGSIFRRDIGFLAHAYVKSKYSKGISDFIRNIF